jgi:hypothetical protein
MPTPKAKVSLKIPDSLMRTVDKMVTAEKNKYFREGLKKAAKLPHNTFKKQTRRLRQQSEQSSGTLNRANAKNVKFPSSSNPDYGYMYVGFDYHYEETLKKNNLSNLRRIGKSGATYGKANVGKAGIAGIGTYIKRGQKRQVKAVKGYQKRIRKTKTGGTGVQRNVVNQYWHLVNDGFRHKKSGNRVAGKQFQQANFRINESKMVEILTNSIQPLFKGR